MEKRSTRQILKDNLQRTSPLRNRFILWLHDIRSLHNVGAAFRSADAFGIREIIISGYTPRPPRPEITKTAIGAEEHVKWSSVEQIGEKAAELKQNNWKILGLEQTSTSRMIHQYPVHDYNICLVLGNEVTGISDEMLPLLDESVEIPQFGMKHSLNVSVAAGVALYAFFDKFESADT